MSTSTIDKPAVLPVQVDKIPEDLRSVPRWLVWNWTRTDKGKWTKPPYSPITGRQCSKRAPDAWATFELALRVHQAGRFDGIGFEFEAIDDLAGIDLDDCRDPNSGELSADAQFVIDACRSYTEISPSGCGVKIFFRGKLPSNKPDHDRGFEAYQEGCYFCVTGRHLENTPREVRELSAEEIADLWAFMFDAPSPAHEKTDRTHDEEYELAIDALSGLSAARAEGYFDWLLIGMALHATDQGLLPQWEEWSKKSTKYQEGECPRKWKSFGAGSRAVGLGSLVRWAEADGWLAPWKRNGGSGKKTGRKRAGTAPPKDGRPVIIIGVDEERVVSEAVTALTTRHDVFQRGGCLVRIVRDGEPPRCVVRPRGAPRIGLLARATLREILASAAIWAKIGDDKKAEAVHPTSWAVEAVQARGEWPGISRLEAVTEVPVLRADGEILQTAGYDEASGIIFEPSLAYPPVPSNPSRDDAIRAKEALLEVIADFPLVDDAHRAAWVCSVLTPLARLAFHGPAPLHMVDANVRGCGKGKLVDSAVLIATGRDAARMAAPTDREEFRKAVTAIAIAGEPVVLFDNLTGSFGNGIIDAVLTATAWKDRILGVSELTRDLPLLTVWYATANNISMAADTARRTLWIRLESPEETPEERTGFKHPDLLAWIAQQRPRLVTAALTMLRAYCAAGRPKAGLPPWGSFEAWSDLVREAVVWAGMPDPAATRRELTSQADREAAGLRQLLDGWREMDPKGDGMTVAEAMKWPATYPDEYETLRAAIAELVPVPHGKFPSVRSVAMKLFHLRRRVIGGRFIDNRPSAKGAVWFVREVDAGTKGTKGTNSGLHAGEASGNFAQGETSPFTGFSPSPATWTDAAKEAYEDF